MCGEGGGGSGWVGGAGGAARGGSTAVEKVVEVEEAEESLGGGGWQGSGGGGVSLRVEEGWRLSWVDPEHAQLPGAAIVVVSFRTTRLATSNRLQ